MPIALHRHERATVRLVAPVGLATLLELLGLREVVGHAEEREQVGVEEAVKAGDPPV